MRILFGSHHKTGLFLGFISMHLQGFLRSMLRTGTYFVGCLFKGGGGG